MTVPKVARRRLLSIAIGDFPNTNLIPGRAWPPLPFALGRARDLVTAAEAYTEAGFSTELLLNPDRDTIARTVVAEIEGLDDESCLIVHVISHGATTPDRPDLLDVVPRCGRLGFGTDVSNWISSAQRQGRRTLFLLDLCSAGRAARVPWQLDLKPASSKVWVLAATAQHEAAYAGRFTGALTTVLRSGASGMLQLDRALPFVKFSLLAREVQLRLDELVLAEDGMRQQVYSTLLDPAHEEPPFPFFPNVAHDPSLVPRPRSRRLRADFGELLVELDDIMDVDHFVGRASGVPQHAEVRSGTGTDPLAQCHFTGRREYLRDIIPWMDAENTTTNLLVVTGSPGSGKSALISVLVAAAHPKLQLAYPNIRLRLPEEHRPSARVPIIAVHARQQSVQQVFRSIARQLTLVAPPDGKWTADRMTQLLHGRQRRPVIVIDAVDEALQPEALAAQVIMPLAAAYHDGVPACRQLVGMRNWPELAAVLRAADEQGGLFDLDRTPPETLRDDLFHYVHTLLTGAGASAGLAGIRKRLAIGVAERIVDDPVAGTSRAGGGQFLIAGLFVHHLRTHGLPTTESELLRALATVPQSLTEVLDLDIRQRQNPWFRPVLEAIAHAKGSGIPHDLVVQIVRGAHAAGPPRRDIVLDSINEAQFYLRHATDIDGSVLVRLFHQHLAEHLLGQVPAPAGGA